MFLKPYNMKKNLIVLILVLGVVTLVGAQDNSSGEFSDGATTCQKYKFSINFGHALVHSNIVDLPGYSGYEDNVQPEVPFVNGVSLTNPSTNMIGVEFRWTFKPFWSLNLTGLGILIADPMHNGVMGIYDSDAGGWIIPAINSVPFETEFDWNVEIGVSKYFDLPNKNLLPYVGFSFLYAHESDKKEYPLELDSNIEDPALPRPEELRGMMRGEFLTWGFATPIGAEYFIAEGLFIGLTINAVNYFYSMTQIAPGEGMNLARADQSTFSFFTRPMLKLGIAF